MVVLSLRRGAAHLQMQDAASLLGQGASGRDDGNGGRGLRDAVSSNGAVSVFVLSGEVSPSFEFSASGSGMTAATCRLLPTTRVQEVFTVRGARHCTACSQTHGADGPRAR